MPQEAETSRNADHGEQWKEPSRGLLSQLFTVHRDKSHTSPGLLFQLIGEKAGLPGFLGPSRSQ